MQTLLAALGVQCVSGWPPRPSRALALYSLASLAATLGVAAAELSRNAQVRDKPTASWKRSSARVKTAITDLPVLGGYSSKFLYFFLCGLPTSKITLYLRIALILH